MSYILDAIRKSDQQRQRGVAPTLLTAHVMAPGPKRSVSLPYGFLAGALVGAGILIGWLRPLQQEQQVAPTAPVAAKLLGPSPPDTASAPLPPSQDVGRQSKREFLPQESASGAPPAPAHTNGSVQQNMVAFAKTEKHNASLNAATAAPTKTAAHTPVLPVGRDPSGGVQEQKEMAMAELPLPIQQEIPSMSISVHAYSSKPQERLVSINNHLLREGGNLAPGLTLEQITPDGMIFSYKGYRFRHGVRTSGDAAESK